MRSTTVSIGDTATADQYNKLRLDAFGAAFLLPHEQNTPDLTLKVEAGVCYVGATRVIYAGGNSPSFTAPSSNPRIDLLTIDSSGTIGRTAGTENASPSVPTYPKDKIVLAEVYCRVSQTTIRDSDQGSNGYIKQDVRPFFRMPRAITQGNSEIYGASSGGTDAYAITLDPAISSYADGMVIAFKADVANTGAATLNVNAVGAKTIKKTHDIDLADADIEAGQIVIVQYDASGDVWQMQSQISKSAPSATDFGDGSDGAAAFDGSTTVAGASRSGNDYTLTRDVYYTNATISTGCTLNPAGYRMFCTGTLTLNGTGKVFRNGNNGSNGGDGGGGQSGNGAHSGSGGSGGAGGSALSDGYLKGGVAGATGGGGGGGNSGNPYQSGGAGGSGSSGNSVSNSVGVNGVGSAGSGGSGGGGNSPGGSGSAGAATAALVRLIHGFALSTMLDINADNTLSKYTASAGSAGGGGASGGGGNNVNANGAFGGGGGGGGGAGGNGGIIYIAASAIVIGASAAIEAKGGNAGNGGNGGSGASGSDGRPCGGGGTGGGGTGGVGGIVVLIYQSLTNSGSISVAAGVKGTKGATVGNGAGGGGGNGAGSQGSDGSDGAAGVIYQFAV